MKAFPQHAFTAAWYLVQVRPNSFHIAERNLQRQHVGVFCPHQLETRRRGGRFRAVPVPLYPGYLFVTFDAQDAPWRKINSTYGVSRLVTFGNGYPKALPDGLVEDLQLRCGPDGELLPLETLVPGDRVRLRSGPFADMVCEVERLDTDERVALLMDLMGRQTRTWVARDELDRIPVGAK